MLASCKRSYIIFTNFTKLSSNINLQVVIFKNAETEDFFHQQGYVKLPLISQKGIENIIELFKKTAKYSGLESKFYTSIWSDNKDYKKKVDQELKRILKPFLDEHFKDYQTAFANFMVKRSGTSSALQPHQDWTFVKEPEHYSLTVWIPLRDVSKNNGALEVFPGSNKLKNYVRARFMNSPFSAHNEYIEKELMKSIPVKKGEALLVNSRTIHASPDNLSGEDRIVASIVVCPKSTPLVHFVLVEESEVEKLTVDQNFYVKYSCFDKPSNAGDCSISSLEIKPLSLSELTNLLN